MRYSGVTDIRGKKAIWLQNVGYVQAKPIEHFRPGEKIAYNWGQSSKIVSIKKATPSFFNVETMTNDGKKYTSRVKKGTYKPFYD